MQTDKVGQQTAGDNLKTFDIAKNWSGHNLNSFQGRLSYFFEVCCPSNSFIMDSTVLKYQKEVNAVLKAKADGQGLAKMTQAEFDDFRSKRVVLASSTSPDTGAIIPWPTRTCCFVPTNIPIIAGMILSPATQSWTIFWQWINQTYNAGLNYGNRNASSTQTTGELLQAYSIATGTALAVACSLRFLQGALLGGKTTGFAAFVNYFIGYAAVATSSSANVVAMRKKELDEGIEVRDADSEEVVGVSKVAAKEAITRTVASRFTYVVPIFFTPALWNIMMKKVGLMPKRMSATRVLLETLGVAMGLYVAMPLNCALYPQMSTIQVGDLELEIQEAAKARGLTSLYYNKGL